MYVISELKYDDFLKFERLTYVKNNDIIIFMENA